MHVAAGDQVEAGQIVMDLETEKAVVELPCPHGGTVAKLHVSAGDTVRIGQTLLTIDGVKADTGNQDRFVLAGQGGGSRIAATNSGEDTIDNRNGESVVV